MKWYGVKDINIYGKNISGIFECDKKTDIDNAFDCAIDINTFKYHLNKVIEKYFLYDEYREWDHKVEYGIGIYFSFNNYISKIPFSQNHSIFFIGDSIEYANELSLIVQNEINFNILLNDLLFENFSDEYKEQSFELIEKTYKMINDENIHGSDAIYTNYLNWINNNV